MAGTDDLIQQVSALVENSDVEGLYRVLSFMDKAGETNLRRWYNAEGRKRVQEIADRPNRTGRACELVLAFTLTPSAIRVVKVARLGRFDGPSASIRSDFGYALLSAARRGHEFCGELVEAASVMKNPPLGWGSDCHELFLLFTALISRYDLPYPSGSGYVNAWAAMLNMMAKWTRDDQWPANAMFLLANDDTFWQPVSDESLPLDFHRLTPQLESLWCAAFMNPDSLAELTALNQEWWGQNQDGWQLEECVHDALSDGLVLRDHILDAAVDALAVSMPVKAQRVLAKALSALDLRGEDAASRVPQFLAALPVVDGSLVGVLLPPILGAPLEPNDLEELGLTIIARKEKAHKKTLITALEKWPADPLSDQVVTDLLVRLGAMDDQVLAGMADKALTRRSGGGNHLPKAVIAEDVMIDVPLVVAPDPYKPVLRQPFEASAAGLTRLASECAQRDWITRDADCLDVFVRLAAGGIDNLRHDVDGLQLESFADMDVAYWLPNFLETGTVKIRSRWHQTVWLRLRDEFIKETCGQLGKIDELLSTPTWSNGVLSIEDLAARMGRAKTCGRYDLAQALLRLEPATPDQACVFSGIRCRINGVLSSDAVRLVKKFIADGGLAPRKTRVEGDFLIAEEVEVPDSLLSLTRLSTPLAARFASSSRNASHGNDEYYLYQWDNHAAVLGMTPHWADAVVVACTDEDADQRADYAQRLPLVFSTPGPFGRATYNYLVRMLHHVRQDSRLIAVEQTLRLIAQGRFDAEQFGKQVHHLAQKGRLTLTRTASSWEQLLMGGAAREVLTALLDVVEWACSASPKPAGLADLLRMTRVYWPAVAKGAPLPEAVRSLVLTKGSSKAVVEARALVEVTGL